MSERIKMSRVETLDEIKLDRPSSVPMQDSVSGGAPMANAPSFYLTGRQPLRPGAVVLAVVMAAGALSSVLLALEHAGTVRLGSDGSAQGRAGGTAREEKDDPDQVDTIVLGDPADAPVPARRGEHVSPVHPTIIVRLPRFGEQVGLIPNSAAGHLLYDWLAAFNHADAAALARVLPNAAGEATVAMQMELREQTGGLRLISAKEVQSGVIVFRLEDQTPEVHEVLGTLQMVSGSNPALVASFSLRGVSAAREDSAAAPQGLMTIGSP